MDKDLRKLVAALEAQGFECTTTKKGRVIVTLHGNFVVAFTTSGDWRAIRNTLAPLKRAGFRWPPKR